MNPVRKGLVQVPEEWPFVIDRARMIERPGMITARPEASPYPEEQWKTHEKP